MSANRYDRILVAIKNGAQSPKTISEYLQKHFEKCEDCYPSLIALDLVNMEGLGLVIVTNKRPAYPGDLCYYALTEVGWWKLELVQNDSVRLRMKPPPVEVAQQARAA